ncbi:MAG: response regulator [Woeseia sp.]
MRATYRVLVVEDDRATRKLLHRLLTSLDLDVDLARDGNEGYSLWASNPYDLLLTGCSMPGMDDFELASRIRGVGKRKANRVPIIVVTGSDYGSRCLASPINDFIRKPIADGELRRVLRRWLPGLMQGLEQSDQPSRTTGENRSGSVSASRTAPVLLEDSAIMKSIVKTFVKSMPDYRQALEQACAAGSRQDIAAAAHKLKSAAGFVGGTEVADLCGILEETAHDADCEEITRLGRRIDETVQALGNSLKSLA